MVSQTPLVNVECKISQARQRPSEQPEVYFYIIKKTKSDFIIEHS